MAEQWDFYFRTISGAPASLFVNLDAKQTAPRKDRPHLIYPCVYLRNPGDDGLPRAEESAVLESLEEQLLRAVPEPLGALYVGRVTAAGRRVFYFYTSSDAGAREAVQRAMEGFPAYRYDYGDRNDADWSLYREVLYPPPVALRWIKDRRIVDALEARGDLLTERDVRHRACFPSPEARAAFVEEAAKTGFLVQDGEVNSELPLSHAAEIIRRDRVDLDSIHAVAADLMAKAERHGGEYLGWEADRPDDSEPPVE